MPCTITDLILHFVVSKLSRYTQNPSVNYWKVIIRIFGYVKRTKSFGLFYNKFPSVLKRYSNASWNTSIIDNISMSRWIFTLGGGAIS